MRIPRIQDPLYFPAIFTFVAGFPVSLVMLFPGIFLAQATQLSSNQCGMILCHFFSFNPSESLTFAECSVSQLHTNPV